MAKNVDDLVMKVSVEGKEALDGLNAGLGNIDKNTKSAADSLKQFNIRNVAYQIQDLSVQLAMGTNAFVALGQQLPQLLSGFGVAGAVIGAVAAVAIPLLQYGLKAAGVDMRNLAEMTNDLVKSNEAFINAQKQNQASLQGLGNSYGSLTPLAKDFFDVQEKLIKNKAVRDSTDAVNELKDSYKFLTTEAQKSGKDLSTFAGLTGIKETLTEIAGFRKGLTLEQGAAVADMLKGVDAKSPEKTVKAINDILNYLNQIGPSADKFKQSFENAVKPLMDINAELVKQQTNIRETAERASKLSAELMNLQTPQVGDINAARRNFDQISAIRKEGELKLQEFQFQLNEKTAQDGANREKELQAFKLKNNQEISDKVKDFLKSQDEAYRSVILQNDARREQLKLQGQIISLSEEGRLSAFNTYQLEQDLLQNTLNYTEALKAVAEQRRKNVISAEQQSKLEKEAADIREKTDQNAYAAAERRQKSFLENQKLIIEQDTRRLELFNRTIGISDREKKNAEAIFNINEERAKQLKGLEQLNDPVLRAVKEKEINGIYDERVASIQRQQAAELDLQHNFGAGWATAFANYREESENAFKSAQSLFQKVTQSMEDNLLTFFKTGKFGWKNFANSIIDEMLRIQIKQLSMNLMGFASGGSSGGGILSGIGKLLGFAGGGIIPTNGPVVVGERGPELLMGARGMSVTPNSALGSSSVTYNINAVDAMSFKQMLAQDPTFLHAVAEQGRRTLPGAR